MSSYRELLLGKILLKNRLISEEDLRRCLEIQEREKSQGQTRPLGEILVAEGLVSREDVAKAVRAQKKTEAMQKSYLLGMLALKSGLLSQEDLEKCLEEQRTSPTHKSLGEVLVEKQLLSPEQLESLLQLQRKVLESTVQKVDLRELLSSSSPVEEEGEELAAQDPKNITHIIGEVALAKGLLSREQLQRCFQLYQENKQKGRKKNFFQVLEESGLLSPHDLEEIEQEIMVSSPRRDLIANYQILKKIGMGAMGVVYKALDPLGRTVALKVLLPKYSNDQKFYKRFMREGYIATTLDHPNIVKAYEVGISDEFVYFSMEYVQGETVGQLIRRNDAIPPKFALFIVGEIAKALECAHNYGLVHRDIKPDNIIITHEGDVKLCDLGIAKEIHSQKPDFTPTDRIVGTPYYVSPELVQGEEEIDIRSDIYSLGASLYHMVVGEVPFDGDSAPRIMVRHVLETPLPPKQRRPWLPQEVSDLIMRMMEKDVTKRIQTPSILYHEVVKVLARIQEKV